MVPFWVRRWSANSRALAVVAGRFDAEGEIALALGPLDGAELCVHLGQSILRTFGNKIGADVRQRNLHVDQQLLLAQQNEENTEDRHDRRLGSRGGRGIEPTGW